MSGDFSSTDSKLPGSHQHYSICLTPKSTLSYCWFLSNRATQFGLDFQRWLQFKGKECAGWYLDTVLKKKQKNNTNTFYRTQNTPEMSLFLEKNCSEILLLIIRFGFQKMRSHWVLTLYGWILRRVKGQPFTPVEISMVWVRACVCTYVRKSAVFPCCCTEWWPWTHRTITVRKLQQHIILTLHFGFIYLWLDFPLIPLMKTHHQYMHFTMFTPSPREYNILFLMGMCELV